MTEGDGTQPERFWFDARPLTDRPPKVSDAPDSARSRFLGTWQGGSAKERLESLRTVDLRGMAADWWNDAAGGGRRLERFAAANGCSYLWQKYDHEWMDDALPGMIFRGGERRDILSWGDPVAVEFGNWSSVGQELILAFGYIAVRHDLGLPHLVVDARANDAEPPRGSWAYAGKSDYTSLSENYHGSDSASPMGRIRSQVEPLDLGAENDAHFRAYCDLGRAAEARAFLGPETLRMLRAASMEFDVEITGQWIYLYARAIEVSWPDPDRWAWIFSIASRLWDRVAGWRTAAGVGLLDGVPAGVPPFYTERLVERPADLATLPKPSPGWQAFWDLGDPHA